MWFKRKKPPDYIQEQIDPFNQRLIGAHQRKLEAEQELRKHYEEVHEMLGRLMLGGIAKVTGYQRIGDDYFDDHEWVNYPLLDIPDAFLRAFEED